MDLEDEFKSQKSLVKKLVRNAGVQITPSSTFEWFYESLRPQEEFSKVSQINARLSFDHFVKKAMKSSKRMHDTSDDSRSCKRTHDISENDTTRN